MSVYVKKKCPACGAVIEVRTYPHYPSEEERIRYGSPIIKCEKCNEEFIDIDYHEIALEGVRDIDRSVVRSHGIIFGLMGVVGIIISLIVNMPSGAVISAGIYGFPLLIEVVSYKKRQYNLDMETIESKKRLCNPLYAVTLKKIGYPVPDMYLPGADLNTMPESISKLEEEEKNIREKIEAESKKNTFIYLTTIALLAVAYAGSY